MDKPTFQSCIFCGSPTEIRHNTQKTGFPERSQIICKRKACGFRGPQVFGANSKARAATAYKTWHHMIGADKPVADVTSQEVWRAFIAISQFERKSE